MYYYRIYGLSVSSTHSLQGVTAQAKRVKSDLQIHWHPIPYELHWQAIDTAELRSRRKINMHCAKHGEQTVLRVSINMERAKQRFSLTLEPVSGQVWLDWSDTVPLADIEAYLLGPGLGFILRARGVSCLHGAVVSTEGRAVALLGAKKTGKSTTAAVLADHGWSVLADDIVVPEISGQKVWVQPGYARIRLWPESLHALQHKPDTLSKVTAHLDKRYLNADSVFYPRPLPLAAIYILEQRNNDHVKPFINSIATKDKIVSLLKNSHVSYGVITPALRAKEFTDFHALAARVPIRTLCRADNITQLQQISQLLSEDIKTTDIYSG